MGRSGGAEMNKWMKLPFLVAGVPVIIFYVYLERFGWWAVDAAKDIEKATDGFFEWMGGL
jgi:hypothetical protein